MILSLKFLLVSILEIFLINDLVEFLKKILLIIEIIIYNIVFFVIIGIGNLFLNVCVIFWIGVLEFLNF